MPNLSTLKKKFTILWKFTSSEKYINYVNYAGSFHSDLLSVLVKAVSEYFMLYYHSGIHVDIISVDKIWTKADTSTYVQQHCAYSIELKVLSGHDICWNRTTCTSVSAKGCSSWCRPLHLQEESTTYLGIFDFIVCNICSTS